jgi:hypothetical protein
MKPGPLWYYDTHLASEESHGAASVIRVIFFFSFFVDRLFGQPCYELINHEIINLIDLW